MGIDTQVTHNVVAMEKVAEYHVLTKCSKCNTFQVISDLVDDFMNFNALKVIKKFIKNNLKRSRHHTHTGESTSGLVHICKIREKSLQ